uniref:Mediator of RNA polymerase II transcription subunit 18 n=1 Tax=Solanum lycopersicum TaxID=4081 RepID=A0A3Q7FJU7_SOLLC
MQSYGGSVESKIQLVCDLEKPEDTWTVRHVGGPMIGSGAEKSSFLVRPVQESKITKNAQIFFKNIGYKLDHKHLRVGFAFHFQKDALITVTVSSINKIFKLHAIDDAVSVTPGTHLVEVTAQTASTNYNEVVASVSSFCEYLALLLHLSKPGVSTGVVPTAVASLMSDG